MIKSLFKKIFISMMVTSLLISYISPGVAALSEDQKKLFNTGVLYYDKGFNNDCSIASTTSSNNKVYIIGDSYGVGINSTISKKLKDKGYELVSNNSKVGRTVTQAISELDKDKSAIESAGNVVVLLGTNPDGDKNAIPKFLQKLNSINSSSRKFWVNISTTGSQYNENKVEVNKILDDSVEEFNISIIDFNSIMASNKKYISSGLHPNAYGYVALSDLIVKNLGPAPSVSTPQKNISNNEETNKNAPIIWSYFINKGLSPVQTAGLVGNLQSESALIPSRVQGDGIQTSLTLKPEYYDVTGYGLAQWTSEGRQVGLINFAKSQGKSESDLQVQLDYIMKELNGGYVAVFNELKKATTLREATDIILTKYEGPLVLNLEERLVLAQKLLAVFAGFSGDISGCNNLTASGLGWDLEGSNKMVYYSQYDNRWKNTIYGTCTVGEGGCGPTSFAMIAATLNNDESIIPPDVAKELEQQGAAPSCGTDKPDWPVLAKKYNLKAVYIGANLNKAAEVIKSGGLVTGSFGDTEFPTLFTNSRHIMVIRKVSPDGNSFYLADSIGYDRETNTEAYSREKLLSRDGKNGGALNFMWAFTK